MSVENLYKAELLEEIVPKSSIRGTPDPHITAFSKFLFMDHDINSFVDLKKYSDTSSYVDELSLFYGLACLCFEKKYDKLSFKKEFKKLQFSSTTYSKLLSDMNSFIIKPNKRYISNIEKLEISEDLRSFAFSLCLNLSGISLNDSLNYFPNQFNNHLTFIDNRIVVHDFDGLYNNINDHSFFYLLFINKFYNYFNNKQLFLIVEFLINQKKFDAFLLNLYLIIKISDDTDIEKFLFPLNDNLSSIDPKIITSLSHYLLLYKFFKKDYSFIIGWYNQFAGDDVIYDKDGNINWNLDDIEFKPVSYSNFQKNARLYINCLHHLLIYIDKNGSFYSPKLSEAKLNIIGGFSALSWSNLELENFETETSFYYNNGNNFFNYEFFNSDYYNNLDLEYFSKTIFPFSLSTIYKTGVDHKLDKKLTDFFSIFNNKKIFFIGIPQVPVGFDNLSKKDEINLILKTNSHLEGLSKKYNFNFIDINLFCTLKNNIIVKDDLLNNSIVKPEIIVNLINNEILKQ